MNRRAFALVLSLATLLSSDAWAQRLPGWLPPAGQMPATVTAPVVGVVTRSVAIVEDAAGVELGTVVHVDAKVVHVGVAVDGRALMLRVFTNTLLGSEDALLFEAARCSGVPLLRVRPGSLVDSSAVIIRALWAPQRVPPQVRAVTSYRDVSGTCALISDGAILVASTPAEHILNLPFLAPFHLLFRPL